MAAKVSVSEDERKNGYVGKKRLSGRLISAEPSYQLVFRRRWVALFLNLGFLSSN